MATYEVSRTLVKSPPELWAELEGDRLGAAVGARNVRATEPERELAWEADGAAGLARLEPSSWGTKVTLTAWVQETEAEVARNGLWGRLFKRPADAPAPPAEPNDLEAKLNGLLDDLGSAHKKPFTTE
ncbi:MAG: hypothetical protein QOF37_1473 [Thermoleophilaceae bacterium]|jgi:hypothetical protein|nr:hypothetical protein [Thermoleophilaceae bacterium]